MMLESIVAILNADEQLITLLNGKAAIYPLSTSDLGTCIVYDCHSLSDDKVKRTDRLQLTIIADTLAKSLAIESRVKTLLLTFADLPLNDQILQVEVNGGGSLYDEARKKNHRIIYFNIVSRSEC